MGDICLCIVLLSLIAFAPPKWPFLSEPHTGLGVFSVAYTPTMSKSPSVISKHNNSLILIWTVLHLNSITSHTSTSKPNHVRGWGFTYIMDSGKDPVCVLNGQYLGSAVRVGTTSDPFIQLPRLYETSVWKPLAPPSIPSFFLKKLSLLTTSSRLLTRLKFSTRTFPYGQVSCFEHGSLNTGLWTLRNNQK